MQFFTKGAEAVEGEKKDEKGKKKKKDKKYEAKPQKMPEGIQPNNMGTHDVGKNKKKFGGDKDKDPYELNKTAEKDDNRSHSNRSRRSNIHQPEQFHEVQEASKNNSKFMRTRGSNDGNDSMEFDKKEQKINQKPLHGGDVSAIIQRSMDDYNTAMNKTNPNVDPSAAYGLTDTKKNRKITFEKSPYETNHRFLRPQDSLNSLMDEFLGGKDAVKNEEMAPPPEENKKQLKLIAHQNIDLINNIESQQAKAYNLDSMWQQKVDKPKLQNNFLKPQEVQEYKDAAPQQDNNNFRIAKQISYDLSSEFKECTPRQAGYIEECRIGDADLVEFREPNGDDLQIAEQEQHEPDQIVQKTESKGDKKKNAKKEDKSDQTLISKTDQGVSSLKEKAQSSGEEESGMESMNDDDVSDDVAPTKVIKKTSFIDSDVN